MLYPTPIAKLIDSYSKLPGIGIKTATRLAFYTIGMSDDDVNEFAKNLLSAKRELTYCSICGRLTDDDPCSICTDPTRDQTTILVLEDSRDVAAMENIQEYHGLYHVLHGLISPMNGISPDDINLKSLMTRLMDSEVSEVIVATNATADGGSDFHVSFPLTQASWDQGYASGTRPCCGSRYRVCGRSHTLTGY